MQYFLIAHDNNEYGPVDITTLAQWAIEGRLKEDSTLREAESGNTLLAGSVTGIFDSQVPPRIQEAPRTFTTASVGPQPGMPAPVQASQYATYAWICTAVGCLVCGFPLNLAALYFVSLAEKEGDRSLSVAKWINSIWLVLQGCIVFGWLILALSLGRS